MLRDALLVSDYLSIGSPTIPRSSPRYRRTLGPAMSYRTLGILIVPMMILHFCKGELSDSEVPTMAMGAVPRLLSIDNLVDLMMLRIVRMRIVEVATYHVLRMSLLLLVASSRVSYFPM